MYETEANNKKVAAAEIPAEVLAAFAESGRTVLARTLLPWSEHCTECAWPTCYTTCDLYEPRPEDRRCRRFVDGMVRMDHPQSANSYVLRIKFKQWGKLWAPGRLRLYPVEEAKKLEQRDYQIGSTLVQLPLPELARRTLIGKRYSQKKRTAQKPVGSAAAPDSFLFECFNPNEQTIAVSFTVRSQDPKVKIPFQKLIRLKPGFHREQIPVREISSSLDLSAPFSIDIIPNEVPAGTTLYFGAMDFVHMDAVAAKPEGKIPESKTKEDKKVKCVVWDLDNTLWDGVLVEDGAENLRLKPGIKDLIHELDRRGILHSAASKNNAAEALAVLRKFELEEYFLYPQISWNPKGQAVKAIAEALNIGENTLLFVDDQPFERQQVQSVCPDVRVLDAAEYLSIPDLKACVVPVTEEGMARRKMYLMDQTRQAAAQDSGQDYTAFLRQCEIQLHIRPMSRENLDRVHELTQRTNQMNFSGNRYTREKLEEILRTPYLDTYVLACEDRFGAYGVVGFSMVDRREPRMTDLMFSCRVQSKRVEHAFLTHLIRTHTAGSGKDFMADYRKTERNAPSGGVFADIGMRETTVLDGVTTWVFPKDRIPPDDGIVRLVLPASALEESAVGASRA